MCHKVRINYYPPRGDNKEGWDNIDIFGWSLSDANQGRFPLPRFHSSRADRPRSRAVLDLAQRRDARIQEWLSFLLQVAHDRAGAVPRARPLHQSMS